MEPVPSITTLPTYSISHELSGYFTQLFISIIALGLLIYLIVFLYNKFFKNKKKM